MWPGHMHGAGCLSAWAMETGLPTDVWCLCLGLGFVVTLPLLASVSGVCAWLRDLVLTNRTLLRLVVWAVVHGFGLAPRQSWLGFWGVCVCVRA